MSNYRIYYVTTAKPRAGNVDAAGRWWSEIGQKQFETMPGTKAVHSYVTQFGLGNTVFPFEIWQEIEGYAFFDNCDSCMESDIASYRTFHSDFLQYYELGPCRIMGDWPASRPGFEIV